MKEDFLHHVWKFQKLTTLKLKTTKGEIISVEKVGQHNYNSGPDFFNSKIRIDDQLWAGNVEIHIKSSNWYAHKHEVDKAYDTVILHVVWEHDTEIYREDGSTIPTLKLQPYVAKSTLESYNKLFSKNKKWINCETNFATVDNFVIENWLERIYLERLEQKSILIKKELKRSNNHWEALLFKMLAKNFGLKVNGPSFLSIANSIDFSVVKKCSNNQTQLEALLMGQAGLLDQPFDDRYFFQLKEEYAFLNGKFKLNEGNIIDPKFFRLRPANFPTIRLSQLASLYVAKTSFFSEVISAKTLEDFYSLFSVSASSYWNTHYNFEVSSTKRKKKLTNSFIDLLIINTLIPIKFAYANYLGREDNDTFLLLMSSIKPEQNSIISKYSQLKNVSNSAMQTQGLLQLKAEYCNKLKCLNCAIGNTILQ